MLEQFKDYYSKAKMMQGYKFQGKNFTEQDVNDDLVWNVPIYDVVNRKYAAFSSLLEAVDKGLLDPKQNGVYFLEASKSIGDFDFVMLCYLFRLCGSGINYKPKTDCKEDPFGTHGFGNFWVCEHLYKGELDHKAWIEQIPDKGFCDVKGYLLPMIKGGLNNYIKTFAASFVTDIFKYVQQNDGLGIKEVVDYGNKILIEKGFKRQNFVLTAFAMDLAEYFPQLVDQNSDVYVGTNAKKCLKMILPKMKTDQALRVLCDLTGGYSKPYDMEDVACDFIRYIENFQSKEHIELNNGTKYTNNVYQQAD